MTKILLALFLLTFFALPLHAAEEKKAEPVKEETAKEEPKEEAAEEAKKEDEDSEEKAEEESKDEDKDEKQSLAKSSRYAPDFCDFEISFPEAPFSSKKCVAQDDCYDVQSYTMVYDLSTTVDVTVTCNPSTPANYQRYNEQVMKAAMAGMVSERNLTEHQAEFKELEKVKSASITGMGKTGAADKIYVGQLWVGPNSIFTVQAELIGGEHEVADKSYRDILASIKTKEGKQLPKKAKPKNTAKGKNE